MKIISWNVNGLRAVLGKGLQGYLESEGADIVCLQEIKALPEQVADWEPPVGMQAFWNPAERKGYSGTLVLTRHEPLTTETGIGQAEGDTEGRVQTLEFDDFYLVNVYTPNAKSDLSRLRFRTDVWDVAFREHVTRLAERKGVVFCGDLNVAHTEIDLANPKTNRKSAGFTDAERGRIGELLESGFVDTFRMFHPEGGQYTWWSYRAGARARNIGWRIDYVCVSASLRDRVADAFIRQEVMGSDHCPVGVEIR